MNEQNTLCGHPVVAVLKPGDIVVVEVNRQVHAQHWVTLKQFLSESAERLGIGILVLPPDVKVARVNVLREIANTDDQQELMEEKGNG